MIVTLREKRKKVLDLKGSMYMHGGLGDRGAFREQACITGIAGDLRNTGIQP